MPGIVMCLVPVLRYQLITYENMADLRMPHVDGHIVTGSPM